jgi:hypothetical protein
MRFAQKKLVLVHLLSGQELALIPKAILIVIIFITGHVFLNCVDKTLTSGVLFFKPFFPIDVRKAADTQCRSHLLTLLVIAHCCTNTGLNDDATVHRVCHLEILELAGPR